MRDKEKLNMIEDILMNQYEDPVEELSIQDLRDIIDSICETFKEEA